MKILCLMALVALGLSAATGERLSSKDFEQAKKMTKGTLYLRVDVPCIFSTGGGTYGPALMAEAPVVVATPSGSNTGLGVADRVVASRAAWVLRPNDPVANGKLYYTRTGDLEFDSEGLGLFSKSQESLVTFSEIHSLEDSQKAFDRVFSRVPLQDAHPEWPADIRMAVMEHRLIEGMAPSKPTP
jgi:hypothetical protein